MTIISAIFAVGGLLTVLSLFISPKSMWYMALPGFGYFTILVINLFFLCYWFYFHKSNSWIPMIALLASLIYFPQNFSIHLITPKAKENQIKVMSWNVKCFDLYNWTHNKETGEKMMNLIKKENPSILCLQEFYTDNKNLNNLEFIQKDLGYKYVHFRKTYSLRGGECWGVATFSRYPIIEENKVPFDQKSNNVCIRTSIKIKDSIFQIYNTHLQSLHFGVKDYQYLKQVKDDLDNSQWDRTKSILTKLKKGYSERAGQANIIAVDMAQTQGTKILMGDFNDIPMSYTYNTVSDGLNDAYTQAGNGFSPTIDLYLPNLRIDYILADKNLNCNSYKRIKKELSDHYPIIASFTIE
jgi:endonuclease/exonuclease/phosphatase family metal-dependent hydrolase